MIQVNDNGTLRNSYMVQVNANGTLRNVRLIQVNDNGVLRNVHLVRVTLEGTYFAVGVAQAGARVEFLPNGEVIAYDDVVPRAAPDWLSQRVTGIGQHFEIMFHDATGNVERATFGPLDEWLVLDATRTLGVQPAIPPATFSLGAKVSIRDRYTKDVLGTAAISLTAG